MAAHAVRGEKVLVEQESWKTNFVCDGCLANEVAPGLYERPPGWWTVTNDEGVRYFCGEDCLWMGVRYGHD